MVNKGVLKSSLLIVSILAVFLLGFVLAQGNNSGNDEKYCEENSDCVQVVNKSNCCTYSCPSVVNKDTEEASDDWVAYEGGRDYFSLFNQSRENCTCETSCAAVVMYPKCENNLCTLSATPPEDDDDDSDDEDENETETEDECKWQCTKWSACLNNSQTRTCSNPMNCTGEEPKLEKRCVGFNFSKEKVCCKITESETENNQTKNKTEYKWEDRASCLETDEDEEGETKEIVAKSYCMEEIREECEYDTIRERAKCRYQNRFENFSEFKSDSCEGLRNKGLCIALYVRSQNCFEKIGGEERDRCFKQIAEFAQHQLNKEVNESTNKTEGKEKVRRYMVLVLENLQQRVERAVIKSRLTAEQGAALTEKIIEIKQSILDGAGKEEIRSQLKELKELWKSYKVGEEENE